MIEILKLKNIRNVEAGNQNTPVFHAKAAKPLHSQQYINISSIRNIYIFLSKYFVLIKTKGHCTI